MKDGDLRRRYDAQFRWEEGMLVYRHRQRGLPVEVSEAERDRAIERFVRATHTVTRAGIATFMVSAIAFNVVVPGAFERVELIVAAMVSSGILFAGAMRWAWSMPTQGWRTRDPVGERLGRTGALVMMVEHLSWPRIVAGIIATLVLVPVMATVGSSDAMAWPPHTAGQWVAALLIGVTLPLSLAMAAVKWALHERARLRRRGAKAIEEARRSGDGAG